MTSPPGWGCRVEAETRTGRIESEMPEIVVSDDGSHAAGNLGMGNHSVVIRVVAERDISFGARRPE